MHDICTHVQCLFSYCHLRRDRQRFCTKSLEKKHCNLSIISNHTASGSLAFLFVIKLLKKTVNRVKMHCYPFTQSTQLSAVDQLGLVFVNLRWEGTCYLQTNKTCNCNITSGYMNISPSDLDKKSTLDGIFTHWQTQRSHSAGHHSANLECADL